MNEHEMIDNDLEERLYNLRNLIDLALLAFAEDRHDLIPTALEEMFGNAQSVIFDYCTEDIKEELNGKANYSK